MTELASRVHVTHGDMQTAVAIIEHRFEDKAVEAERVTVAREFLAAALAVERAFRAHSRCALVNHCGTRGSNNLLDATDVLFHALSDYAAATRAIATRFPDVQPVLDEESGEVEAIAGAR